MRGKSYKLGIESLKSKSLWQHLYILLLKLNCKYQALILT